MGLGGFMTPWPFVFLSRLSSSGSIRAESCVVSLTILHSSEALISVPFLYLLDAAKADSIISPMHGMCALLTFQSLGFFLKASVG